MRRCASADGGPDSFWLAGPSGLEDPATSTRKQKIFLPQKPPDETVKLADEYSYLRAVHLHFHPNPVG